LQPDVIIQFHPEFYFADVADQARLKAASMERLKGVFTTLESALESGPYFFGDMPTVPDFILATQTIWDVIFPDQDITAYPNITRQRNAIYALPATQRMVAQHAAEQERRKQAT
jgi:glutathione S-transferase